MKRCIWAYVSQSRFFFFFFGKVAGKVKVEGKSLYMLICPPKCPDFGRLWFLPHTLESEACRVCTTVTGCHALFLCRHLVWTLMIQFPMYGHCHLLLKNMAKTKPQIRFSRHLKSTCLFVDIFDVVWGNTDKNGRRVTGNLIFCRLLVFRLTEPWIRPRYPSNRTTKPWFCYWSGSDV